MRWFLLLTLSLSACSVSAAKPNIVVILADDLGIGDVQSFNPEGKIPTPNIDRLANEGMRFTDAHSPSAVCTPTRYGLMTGRYAWRTRLKSSVLGGISPHLIDRKTIADMLQVEGYHTACIGKWHLGMDWQRKPGKDVPMVSIEKPNQHRNVDFDAPIKNGPNTNGFDYYFGISASLDMIPYTYIRNDHVTASPTEEKAYPSMTGRSQGTTRKGPAAPGFEVVDVLPTLAQESVNYINERAKEKKPFFLYLPYASPHTPIAPTKDWLGKSKLNPYADFVMQTDAAVGQLLDALDNNDLTKNTLVVFTSDNGCSPQAKFDELLAKGHDPSGIYRGMKADIYEGGHRVPFVVRWPGNVKPGTLSDRTITHTDIVATVADVLKVKFDAPDGVSFLPTLRGDKQVSARGPIVNHSINGSFAIRDGKWKLCLCPGSGGFSEPRPPQAKRMDLPEVQLYNLDADPGETTNLAKTNTERVEKLKMRLAEIRNRH